MRWRRSAAVAIGVLVAGCGSHAQPLAQACIGTGDGHEILAALRRAPAPVALTDGTSLSECVKRAVSGSDLQNVGAVFSRAGAELSLRAARDPGVALRLGYLVGAVERGGDNPGGFQAELMNRMRSFLEDPAVKGAERAAMSRGRARGRARG